MSFLWEKTCWSQFQSQKNLHFIEIWSQVSSWNWFEIHKESYVPHRHLTTDIWLFLFCCPATSVSVSRIFRNTFIDISLACKNWGQVNKLLWAVALQSNAPNSLAEPKVCYKPGQRRRGQRLQQSYQLKSDMKKPAPKQRGGSPRKGNHNTHQGWQLLLLCVSVKQQVKVRLDVRLYVVCTLYLLYLQFTQTNKTKAKVSNWFMLTCVMMTGWPSLDVFYCWSFGNMLQVFKWYDSCTNTTFLLHLTMTFVYAIFLRYGTAHG